LNADLHQRIREKAAMDGTTMGEILERCMKKALDALAAGMTYKEMCDENRLSRSGGSADSGATG
jgi:hypothetical protein